MKAVINWILFIPVLLLTVGIELFTALNPAGAEAFFGMDVNGIADIVLIAIAALFAVMFLLSLFDRKTSPVHVLKHNYPAGICGVIAAFALAGDTASKITTVFSEEAFGAIDILTLLVSAVAAVALLLCGINHCTATNTKNKTSVLYLAIPLWCAVHLLSRFMAHTATPVAMAETLDLVMYVLLAIFFMYSMMVVSLINGKNPVKASIYWGAPAAVASLVYAVSILGKNINVGCNKPFDYLEAVTCGFIGLYVLCFVAELSFMSKTVEQQYVVEPQKEEEPAKEDADDKSDDYDVQTELEAVVINDDVVNNDFESEIIDSHVESEINESMKKYFDDISSVESEIEEDITLDFDDETEEVVEAETRDYGSYFEDEVTDMHIEDENLTVDTTKKHSVDKSKYPISDNLTVHEPAIRDSDYVVGIETVDSDANADETVAVDATTYDTKEKSKSDNSKSENSYESRLDEIDRLIISIQGEQE